jgi:hypothetical protein
MLDIVLTTKHAWRSQDLDDAEIHMNELTDLFDYNLLTLEGWHYVQICHKVTGAYLGYVADHPLAMAKVMLRERFEV